MDTVTYLHSRLVRTERGAALVEYSLLIALIAVACLLALTTLGEQVVDKIVELGETIAAS